LKGKETKYYDIAHYLVEKGADPNVKNSQDKKYNILMDAVGENMTDYALLLIKKGADVSYVSPGPDPLTLITVAAHNGQHSVVAELIQRGAPISTKHSTHGLHPLIAASSSGHTSIVELLLKTKNVDINAVDNDGTNSLMAAALTGHKSVVSLLISKGIKINAQNDEGHSALMFAYNGKHQLVHLQEKYKEFVKEVDIETNNLLKVAVKTQVDIINEILRAGADPYQKDNDGHISSDFDV
jgi:ankyrin repeat protein